MTISYAAVAAEIDSGVMPNCSDMAKTLKVVPRTIHRYLSTLRMLGAPLRFDGTQNGYYFAKPWSFDVALMKWLANPAARHTASA